jgi:cell division septal protein FtsQ
MHLFTGKRTASHRKQSRTGRVPGMQNKKELLAAILVAAACLALAKASVPLIRRSGLFELRELKIFGCNLTRPEEVMAQAQIAKGMDLLSINLSRMSSELEAYSYIYKAVLERKLPGTLEVYIEERNPRALIRLEELYLVDERGDVFKKALAGEQHYPVLSGLSTDDLYRDSEHCRQLIRSALALLDTIARDRRFAGLGVELAIDKTRGFTIITAPERMVIEVGFGDASEKFDSLWKIVDDLREKGLAPETIHLKSAQKAYVTLKG